MKSYEEMLEEARSKLPESVLKVERFEIPEVTTFVQGNKTIIENFKNLCDITRRNPQHLAKYFFKELATPGEISGNRLILMTKVSSLLHNKDCFNIRNKGFKP